MATPNQQQRRDAANKKSCCGRLMRGSQRYRWLPLVLSLAAYFASGIGLTIYNKWLLSPAHYGFTYPIALILTHMSSNFFLALFMVLVTLLLARPLKRCFFPSSSYSASSSRQQPHHHHHAAVGHGIWPGWRLLLTRYAPVGVLFGADITLTNVAFQYASVSFVEVIKSGVPVLLFIFAFIAGHESATCSKVVLMVMMSLGICVTSIGEFQTEGNAFDARGAVAAMFATICAAIRLIAMEALLGGHGYARAVPPAATRTVSVAASNGNGPGHANGVIANGNGHHVISVVPSSSPSPAPSSSQPIAIPHTLRVLLFIAPFAALSLVPIFFVVEWSSLQSSRFMHSASTSDTTIGYVAAGACLAFALNMSELCLVKVSSAMTMCVAGVTKFVMVLLLSTWWFGRVLTVTNWIGCSITVLSVASYNYVRIKHANRLARAAATAASATDEQQLQLHDENDDDDEQQRLFGSTAIGTRVDQYGNVFDDGDEDDAGGLNIFPDIDMEVELTAMATSPVDMPYDDDEEASDDSAALSKTPSSTAAAASSNNDNAPRYHFRTASSA